MENYLHFSLKFLLHYLGNYNFVNNEPAKNMGREWGREVEEGESFGS